MSNHAKLLPNQKLISETEFEIEKPAKMLGPDIALAKITNSPNVQEIGEHGPPLAAISPDDNKLLSPELRRYEALFGRDSMQTCIETINIYPKLTLTTLIELARHQGLEYCQDNEEEPGRIAHEIRPPDSPRAIELTKERGWSWPYYGSVDATPMFVILLSEYLKIDSKALTNKFTHVKGQEYDLKIALDRAIDWLSQKLKQNSDRVLEFKTPLTWGLNNQTWKDSWDSHHHQDGKLANYSHGVSTIEAQVYAYNALKFAGKFYESEDKVKAQKIQNLSREVEQSIIKNYWTESFGGYFVLGTDRDAKSAKLRQLKIKTSNMGHILRSDILLGDEPGIVVMREQVISQLFSGVLLNYNGIRTLASDEIRYLPTATHNGTVWPWDSHAIAQGLRHHKYYKLAHELDKRIFNSVKNTNLYPEYLSGDQIKTDKLPTRLTMVKDLDYDRDFKLEHPPQLIQAWTVAAIISARYQLNRFSNQTKTASNFEKNIVKKIIYEAKML